MTKFGGVCRVAPRNSVVGVVPRFTLQTSTTEVQLKPSQHAYASFILSKPHLHIHVRASTISWTCGEAPPRLVDAARHHTSRAARTTFLRTQNRTTPAARSWETKRTREMGLLDAVRRVAARVKSLGGVQRAGVLTGLADGNYGCVRRGWNDDEARMRKQIESKTERTRRGTSRDVRASQSSCVDVADGGRTQAHHAEERIHREIHGTRRVGQQVLRSVRRNRISSANRCASYLSRTTCRPLERPEENARMADARSWLHVRSPSMGGIRQSARLQLDQRPTGMARLAAPHHRPLSGQSQVLGGPVQDPRGSHKDGNAGKLPAQRIVESRNGSKKLEKVHSLDWMKKSMN